MDQSAAAYLSVIIPAFNAQCTLPRTLASLLTIASPQHVQIIVTNDGSTDSTSAIAHSFAADHPNFRWRIIDQTNAGVAAARNAGLQNATGEWLYFLDADDELVTDPLPWLDEAGDATCLGLSVEYQSSGGQPRPVRPPNITPENRLDIFTARMPHPTSGYLVRRSCVTHTFDADIRYTEDWLFYTRNAAIFERYRALPERRLTRIHIHDANASSHYAKWGIDRARVAARIREAYRDTLTLKQRNNLAIQEKIGHLQQRHWISPHTFIRLPCNPTLYVKLWIYALAALFGHRATPYHPPKPPR